MLKRARAIIMLFSAIMVDAVEDSPVVHPGARRTTTAEITDANIYAATGLWGFTIPIGGNGDDARCSLQWPKHGAQPDTSTYGHISNWDTSKVTTMKRGENM